jgi:pyrroline-5-carboxylate reductase
MELPERLFDAATAAATARGRPTLRSSPTLSPGRVREGIPRDVARRLVVETIGGTAVLLKDRSAHQVRDEVMTPGGTTAAAFVAMEKAGFRRGPSTTGSEAPRRSEARGTRGMTALAPPASV